MDLPEYIQVCPLCDGAGQHEQTYTAGCGMGYYRSMGRCEMCSEPGDWEGCGYVYKATGRPVGKSVVAQIAATAVRPHADDEIAP